MILAQISSHYDDGQMIFKPSNYIIHFRFFSWHGRIPCSPHYVFISMQSHEFLFSSKRLQPVIISTYLMFKLSQAWLVGVLVPVSFWYVHWVFWHNIMFSDYLVFSCFSPGVNYVFRKLFILGSYKQILGHSILYLWLECHCVYTFATDWDKKNL